MKGYVFDPSRLAPPRGHPRQEKPNCAVGSMLRGYLDGDPRSENRCLRQDHIETADLLAGVTERE